MQHISRSSGILPLNKPKGMTSFQAVSRARKALNIKKIGHAGTLDPQATGVLPLAVGSATRLTDYWHMQPKTYDCTITLGWTSTTDDGEGELLDEHDTSTIAEKAVKDALPTFLGTIQQLPPMYSALRHDGQRLYDLARKGITVERTPRDVVIHAIALTSFTPGVHATIQCTVTCGKGTYMRVLARDLGTLLGTGAYLSALTRTSYGPVHLSSCCTIEELMDAPNPSELLLPPDVAISFLPRLDVPSDIALRALQGHDVWVTGIADIPEGECRVHGPRGELIALGLLQSTHFTPTKVFSAGASAR